MTGMGKPATGRRSGSRGERGSFCAGPLAGGGGNGGRGSAKSWSMARALLLLGAQKPRRILCVREFQNSLGESVHRLLAEQIEELQLSHIYTVRKASITGANGTEFVFAGLRHNISKIKS